MKKKLIIIIIVYFLSINFLNFSKNLYLFSTYNFSISCFEPNRHISNQYRQWERVIDSYQHVSDARYIENIIIFSDNTGFYRLRCYSLKIFNIDSEPYSWSPLLPYDQNYFIDYFAEIQIDSQYVKFLPNPNSMVNNGTRYSKFKIKENKFYLDSYRELEKYKMDPIWIVPQTEKIKFSNYLYFSYFFE